MLKRRLALGGQFFRVLVPQIAQRKIAAVGDFLSPRDRGRASGEG